MKKRLAALALVGVLMLALVPVMGAADTVYYTAAEDDVLDLNDATMPFWFAGYLYIDASVFQRIGVGYSLNTVKGTLVLYDFSRSLVFDLNTGSGTDGQGNPYAHVAVTRGGVTFVPASPVATYFGRVYSNNRVNHGYLIRVKSENATLSDVRFLDAAVTTLEDRYQRYQRQNAPESETETTPQPVDTAEEPTSGKSIYLCFLAEDGGAVDELADALDARGAKAAFYFTETALSRCGDQLRRLAAGGHGVGLVADPEEDPLEQAARMNRALFRMAGIKTRLVYAGDGGTGLPPAGLCLLSARIDRSDSGLSTSGGAAALLNQIGRYQGAVSVWMGADVTPAALRTLLASAAAEDNSFYAMTEIVS